jgi:serine phosphatase RsbU (regulator of sigma subunit)
VIGVIYVDSLSGAGLFSEESLRVLTHLANVAAVKIENVRLYRKSIEAEKMSQDLKRAAENQSVLLPSAGPPIPGYLVHATARASLTVGGDYYDFIELPEGRYAIAFGDVAGKGIPAALLMSSVQTGLRAFAELDLTGEETVGRLNRLLCRSIPENRFVTLFYGVLDPVRHTLTYVNAGQTPPYLIRADGSSEPLKRSGFPVGLYESTSYSSGQVELPDGTLVLCYSDGVVEASSGQGEMFGVERLASIARAARNSAPKEIVAAIFENLEAYRGETPQEDDMTLLVVKRTG